MSSPWPRTPCRYCGLPIADRDAAFWYREEPYHGRLAPAPHDDLIIGCIARAAQGTDPPGLSLEDLIALDAAGAE